MTCDRHDLIEDRLSRSPILGRVAQAWHEEGARLDLEVEPSGEHERRWSRHNALLVLPGAVRVDIDRYGWSVDDAWRRQPRDGEWLLNAYWVEVSR